MFVVAVLVSSVILALFTAGLASNLSMLAVVVPVYADSWSTVDLPTLPMFISYNDIF